MPCRCYRRSGREFVRGLPGRPCRSTHGVQESFDIVAAEHRFRIGEHAIAVEPMHRPTARIGVAMASVSRLSRAPTAADTRTRETSATASASEIARAPGVFR